MRRKNTKLYFSRFVIIFLSIMLQAFAAWFLIFVLNRTFWAVQTFTTATGVILFLAIVNREQPAAYKVPWIILFLIFPFAGMMIYITFGNVRVSRKQLKKFRAVYHENNDEYYGQAEVMKKLEDVGGNGAAMAKYLKSVTSLPVYDDSKTVYLPTGEEFYKSLQKALLRAEKYIFMEYFIIEEGLMWEGIYDILAERIASGVEVYIMYDDVGSMAKVPAKFYKTLRTDGINAQVFNKFRPVVSISHNNRDHRKITVIDGKFGFISGANIADEYINATHPFGVWRDNTVYIEGRATDSLVRLFIQLYNMASNKPLEEEKYIYTAHERHDDGFVFPFGDSPAPISFDRIGENVYLDIINRADKYVYITTPYFIVDTNVTEALKCAAKRGVDVRIVVPDIPDKQIIYIMSKSFFPSLIDAGVKIYKFKDGFIHAKTFLSDDDVAVVGTINLDFRSLVHHFECAVWLYKTSSIIDLYNDFSQLFDEECELLDKDGAKLKLHERLLKSLVNLFAPLM